MIKEIEMTDDLIEMGKKEGLIFAKKTKYFGIYEGDKLIGYSGIIKYKNKYIFKNNYIKKEYRGQGYFSKMMKFLLEITKDKPKEANCNKYSLPIYLKYGFKIKKQFNNVTQVIYE